MVDLLKLVEDLGNASRACAIMGVSRASYYRFCSLVHCVGLEAIEQKAEAERNRDEGIVRTSLSHPGWGRRGIARELALRGIPVGPKTVRRILVRSGLETSVKRVRARRRWSAT